MGKPKDYIPKKQYEVITIEPERTPAEKRMAEIALGKVLYKIAVKYNMTAKPSKVSETAQS